MKALINQLRLSRAAALARSGDLTAAETILRPGGELPKDPLVLDLMARIRAQGGDYVAADRLWVEILKSDPTHHSALAGLNRLRQQQRSGQAWSALLWPIFAAVSFMLAVMHISRAITGFEQQFATLSHIIHEGQIGAETQLTLLREKLLHQQTSINSLSDQLRASSTDAALRSKQISANFSEVLAKLRENSGDLSASIVELTKQTSTQSALAVLGKNTEQSHATLRSMLQAQKSDLQIAQTKTAAILTKLEQQITDLFERIPIPALAPPLPSEPKP